MKNLKIPSLLDKEQKEEIEKPLGPPSKLTGYEFYRKTLKSAKFVVAPMVDQSELPWRILSRRYGAQLTYTPMIHSRIFMDTYNATSSPFTGNLDQFQITHPFDRPLIAQFCGNDPSILLSASLLYLSLVEVDAIDLNLGCPQGIARRGFYGSFLMDSPNLVYEIISTLHRSVGVPITAKIRVFESLEQTVQYAQMLVQAGVQVLTVHGRTRQMKGCLTGLADWEIIKKVKESVSIPVFANGNLLYFEDCLRLMKFTGCDGVMTAEGNLYNPALFAPSLSSVATYTTPTDTDTNTNNTDTDTTFMDKCVQKYKKYSTNMEFITMVTQFEKYPLLIEHPPAHIIAMEYLDICEELVNDQGVDAKAIKISSIKGHLFKLLRFVLQRFPSYRPQIGRSTRTSISDVIRALSKEVEDEVCKLSHGLDTKEDTKDQEQQEGEQNETWGRERDWKWEWLSTDEKYVRSETFEGVHVHGENYRVLPYWLCQPYIRSPLYSNSSLSENTPSENTDSNANLNRNDIVLVPQEEKEDGEKVQMESDQLLKNTKMEIRKDASSKRSEFKKERSKRRQEHVEKNGKKKKVGLCCRCELCPSSPLCHFSHCRPCCISFMTCQIRSISTTMKQNGCGDTGDGLDVEERLSKEELGHVSRDVLLSLSICKSHLPKSWNLPFEIS